MDKKSYIKLLDETKKWLVKNRIALAISIGVILGLIAGTIIIEYNKTAKREDVIYSWIKNNKPSVFCPNSSNRKFWDKLEYKPRKAPPFTDIKVSKWTIIEEGTDQECIYHTGEWIPSIEKNLLEVLEDNWRNKKMFVNPLIIDLDTSSKAAELARCICLLKTQLNPEVTKKVREELEKRVIKPYEKELKEYQTRRITGSKDCCPWLEKKDNWKAVCICNIIYASLAIIEDNKRLASIIANSESSINDYLESFENDGYLSSGIRYWNYGFSHFVILTERLIKATDGKLNLYRGLPIKEVIAFPLRTELGTKDWKTYLKSDTGFFPLFTDNNNPVYKLTWVWSILERNFMLPFTVPKINPWNIVYGGPVAIDLNLNPPPPLKKKLWVSPPETWGHFFPSSGALVSTDPLNRLAVATKAGTNKEEHNHNSIGGYTLFERGGDNWSTVTGVLGGIEYLPGRFGRDRYRFDMYSSYGAPVPVVNNCLQNNNDDAVGRVIKKSLSPEVDSVTYEIKDAYGLGELKELKRTITFDKRKGKLSVTDYFDATSPISFETAILSNLTIQITETGAIITGPGKEYNIAIYGSQDCDEKIEDINKDEMNASRLGISLPKRSTNGWISYTITKVESKGTSKGEILKKQEIKKKRILGDDTKDSEKEDKQNPQN
jgi:hypothetical protein